jgi:hypothetical protein
MISRGPGGVTMAGPNKKLARSNKSRTAVLATNRRATARRSFSQAPRPVEKVSAAASFGRYGTVTDTLIGLMPDALAVREQYAVEVDDTCYSVPFVARDSLG